MNDERTKNSILARTPAHEREQILARAEYVHLDPMDILIEPGKPVPAVDFLEDGLHSMLAVVDNVEIEVATVGYEGMVGIPLVLNETETSGKVFCQVPAKGWRIASHDFLELLETCPQFAVLCRRYTSFIFDQAGQNSACNRLHSIEERCAKWLLLSHDRVEGDKFQLTQEFIAQMLGVRRQSVNIAAGILQNAGMIKYSRGVIQVLDRPALEGVACACYGIIRAALQRFLS
jgi:CRP-like cAMP-binding protein